MKRKIKISIAICLITYLIFTFARTMAVAQRGNMALGGEIMLFLIPAIIWIVYRNIKTTKTVIKEHKESEEAERMKYIQVAEKEPSIQIVKIESVN